MIMTVLSVGGFVLSALAMHQLAHIWRDGWTVTITRNADALGRVLVGLYERQRYGHE